MLLWSPPPGYSSISSSFMCLLLQGADIFAAKISIEVQRASEGAIAAIERNGGVISTSFYDPISLGKFFVIHPIYYFTLK